jgi:hypothetical protein
MLRSPSAELVVSTEVDPGKPEVAFGTDLLFEGFTEETN